MRTSIRSFLTSAALALAVTAAGCERVQHSVHPAPITTIKADTSVRPLTPPPADMSAAKPADAAAQAPADEKLQSATPAPDAAKATELTDPKLIDKLGNGQTQLPQTQKPAAK